MATWVTPEEKAQHSDADSASATAANARNLQRPRVGFLSSFRGKLAGSPPLKPILIGESGGTSDAPKNDATKKYRSIMALNAAAAMDGCDDQLLPASFRALETDLRFHPSILGKVTLAQTLAQSLSSPIWGYLADRFSRRRIMAFGMVSWGLVTLLLAFASKLGQIIILRAANGLFLGSIGPVSQSILADISPETSRGFQFGLIQMCTSAGRVVGGVLTTSVALTHIGGIRGWRWTFLGVAILSITTGLVIGFLMEDFERSGYAPAICPSGMQGSKATISEVKRDSVDLDTINQETPLTGTDRRPGRRHRNITATHFFKNVFTQEFSKKSVWLLVLEGIIGTVPWSAMSFLTMYLQYCGLSDVLAGFTAAGVLCGAIISGPLGGALGDVIAEKAPRHGRPFVGQASMLFRIPLVAITFLFLPRSTESFRFFLLCCFGVGLFSIAGVVVNRPLLSDIVHPNHRATTFAIAVAIEGALGSSFGAPIVGLLAEKAFGYVKTDLHVADLHTELREGNARALGLALACLTIIPWIVSFIVYGFLHLTYGPEKDALRVRQFTLRFMVYHRS